VSAPFGTGPLFGTPGAPYGDRAVLDDARRECAVVAFPGTVHVDGERKTFHRPAVRRCPHHVSLMASCPDCEAGEGA
jgi:hypothetical protein